MSRILSILKRREDYSCCIHTKVGLITGLYNSASFVNSMLNNSGVESKLVVVTDNNDIDREVTQYKPTHCIIEAVWVVPSKFTVLQKLHPNVKWIIRIHSEMPFMANEGMALSWFGDYSLFDNIILAPNSPRMLREVRTFLKIKNNWNDVQVNEKVVYLPNYYPQQYKLPKVIDTENQNEYIDIGCFGAIRPLKNHLMQALVAAEFCEAVGRKLKFHCNAGRIEMKGEPVLHNLQGMFEHLNRRGHQLVFHRWLEREEFLNLCSQMDIGMQVSLTETFNIVAADLVSQGIPVVGSREIPWASSIYNSDPCDSKQMINALLRTYYSSRINVMVNQYFLNKYTNKTNKIWVRYFK